MSIFPDYHFTSFKHYLSSYLKSQLNKLSNCRVLGKFCIMLISYKINKELLDTKSIL